CRPRRTADSTPASVSFARWVLAVCGVTRAATASSPAVRARPSSRAVTMVARAGSPTSAATSAVMGPVIISFPAHAQLDLNLAVAADIDPDVRLDTHEPLEHAVEGADRISRDQDDMAVPARLRLALDPVSQGLEAEAHERAPYGRHDQILHRWSLEHGLGAKFKHRRGKCRVHDRIDSVEPPLSGSYVVGGADVRVTDVVPDRVVLVPEDRMLDVVPPLLEADLLLFARPVGDALRQEIEDADEGELVAEQEHRVTPEAEPIAALLRGVLVLHALRALLVLRAEGAECPVGEKDERRRLGVGEKEASRLFGTDRATPRPTQRTRTITAQRLTIDIGGYALGPGDAEPPEGSGCLSDPT